MSGSPPVRQGDRLLFYYSSSSARHSGGQLPVPRPPGNRRLIGVASLRLDGFVSLDADAAGGRVRTVPVRLLHRVLAVNVDAGGGELRARLLVGGRPLPGYDLADCAPVRVDSTRALLSWGHRRLPPRQDPIEIEFHITAASLYSFWTEPLTESVT